MPLFSRRSFRAASLLLAAVALLVATPAKADSVTYTYQGQNYNVTIGSYNTSQSVTGSITLASPLATNLSGAMVYPVSFSFNDGLQTLTNQTVYTYQAFFFYTDTAGDITGYSIYLTASPGPGEYIRLISRQGGTHQDQVADNEFGAAFTNGSGSFTLQPPAPSTPVAPTPEPSSLLLLATGILGGAGSCIRRLRNA